MNFNKIVWSKEILILKNFEDFSKNIFKIFFQRQSQKQSKSKWVWLMLFVCA